MLNHALLKLGLVMIHRIFGSNKTLSYYSINQGLIAVWLTCMWNSNVLLPFLGKMVEWQEGKDDSFRNVYIITSHKTYQNKSELDTCICAVS